MARGNAVLKIAGILLVIFGIVNMLLTMMYGFLGARGFSEMGKSVVTGLLILYGLFGVLASFFQIAVGSVGVRHSNIPEHGTRCIVWGVVTLILGGALTFLLYISSGMIYKTSEFYPPWYGFAIVIVSGIVLPILMIIGGVLNKSMKKPAQKAEEAAVAAAPAEAEAIEEEAEAEEAAKTAENAAEAVEEAAETAAEAAGDAAEETAEETAETAAEKAAGEAAETIEEAAEETAETVKAAAAKPMGRLEYMKRSRLSRNVDPRAARKFGKR